MSCPCPECGAAYDGDGKCGCDPPEPPAPESLAELETEFGTKHVIEYYPENKENSLKAIREIIDKANLANEEFNFD